MSNAEEEKYPPDNSAEWEANEQKAAVNDEKPKEPRGAIAAAEKGDANQDESDDAETHTDQCSDEHLSNGSVELLRIASARFAVGHSTRHA